jgi:hypothetical protein
MTTKGEDCMKTKEALAQGTGSSVVVNSCQVCDSDKLESALFLGYLPPVNTMPEIGKRPKEEAGYPAEMLYCHNCTLAQLGLIVDPNILFPPEYPYSSGTTKILRENFKELYDECSQIVPLKSDHLIIDIGSNDGTLLSNFKTPGHRVHGIEPTLMARKAIDAGIPTDEAFFNTETAERVGKAVGKARIITATNVFAHIENIHSIVEGILELLDDDGVFISESHYLLGLIETLQYDTIYHEHLRYYSLSSITHLLNRHGLEVIHAKRIPTHGGSIRVYAARKGTHPVRPSVKEIQEQEANSGLGTKLLKDFKKRVVLSKLHLNSVLLDIKKQGHRIFGVGAPSRASTLINYVGLDDGILDCVVEVKTSHKVGKYMPGTTIPVRDEACLFEEQPEYALLLSWHIQDELIHNLTKKGFKGKYIVPLPEPRIVGSDGKTISD